MATIVYTFSYLLAATKFQLSLTPPDFAQYRVNDLFRCLGPIAIFSAKRHWTAPRLVQLHRGKTTDGFGFSLRGDAPVIVAVVENNSLAEVSYTYLESLEVQKAVTPICDIYYIYYIYNIYYIYYIISLQKIFWYIKKIGVLN